MSTSVWFSLAMEYGLAFVSLGKPGTGDEQLLTGGLTAVESLLGPEIGAQHNDGLVIDHKSSIMERFPVRNDKGDRIFAQYLLQAPNKDQVVPPELKIVARTFIENLGVQLLLSSFWEELKIAVQVLTPGQIYPYLMTAYESCHRKTKVRIDDKSFTNLLKAKVLNSFTDSSFSETLDKISNQDYEEIKKTLDSNRKAYITQYHNEILLKVIHERPLDFLQASPKLVKDDCYKIIELEALNYKSEQTLERLQEV
ncbi:MAG TPA: hypothetical protein VJ044_03965, partial [Candidatus Hodarchaeales archaeon]|nr:hypothetical protein [Candidatus Hodarchaeales archaeon]